MLSFRIDEDSNTEVLELAEALAADLIVWILLLKPSLVAW